MARKRTRRVEATYKHSTKTKQTGQSKEQNDNYRKAKPPGWRRSARGNWYYEARRNRSDNLSQLDAHNEDAKKRREAKEAALKAAKAAKKAAAKARNAARKATSAARKLSTASKPKAQTTAKKTTGKKRTTQKKLF